MAEKKEPMIAQENRPTAVDYDMPITNFKLRDLHAVINSHLTEKEVSKVEKETHKPEKELLKPEKEKEFQKPEKEILKSEKEKEFHKPEKEFYKTEKERLKPEHFKPEKEGLKPEKEAKPDPFNESLIEQIATRVAAKLKG